MIVMPVDVPLVSDRLNVNFCFSCFQVATPLLYDVINDSSPAGQASQLLGVHFVLINPVRQPPKLGRTSSRTLTCIDTVYACVRGTPVVQPRHVQGVPKCRLLVCE